MTIWLGSLGDKSLAFSRCITELHGVDICMSIQGMQWHVAIELEHTICCIYVTGRILHDDDCVVLPFQHHTWYCRRKTRLYRVHSRNHGRHQERQKWKPPGGKGLCINIFFSHIHRVIHMICPEWPAWMTSYTTCFARKMIMTSQANTPKRQRRTARFF